MWNLLTNVRTDARALEYQKNRSAGVLGYTTTLWGQPDPTAFATSMAGVNVASKAPGASEIGLETRLREPKGWRPRTKQDLYPRPYATSPWFGQNSGGDVATQDSLVSSMGRTPRSVGTIVDRAQTYWNEPQIDTVIQMDRARNRLEETNVGVPLGGYSERQSQIQHVKH